jgi:hypothetical protein
MSRLAVEDLLDACGCPGPIQCCIVADEELLENTDSK